MLDSAAGKAISPRRTYCLGPFDDQQPAKSVADDADRAASLRGNVGLFRICHLVAVTIGWKFVESVDVICGVVKMKSDG